VEEVPGPLAMVVFHEGVVDVDKEVTAAPERMRDTSPKQNGKWTSEPIWSRRSRRKRKPIAVRDHPPQGRRPGCGRKSNRQPKLDANEKVKKRKGAATSKLKSEHVAGPSSSMAFVHQIDEDPVVEGAEDGEDRKRIKEILQKYHEIRRSLQQQAEATKPGCPKLRRSDLKAGKIMRDNMEHFDFNEIGDVPGLNVGDCFFYRFELLLVGLHREVQAGIACYRPKNGDSVASSVIASGGYEDDQDNGEFLVYTGQGGNNYYGDRRQAKDQTATRGNLGLQNSCRQKTPVRVIRGHSNVPSSPSGKVYSYDGLYEVEKFTKEQGNSGFMVFKFFMRRLPGQPELGSNVVKFMGRLAKVPSQRTGLVMLDISLQQEPVPVCVVNTVDADQQHPEPFQYTTKVCYGEALIKPSAPKPCSCTKCHDVFGACHCVAKNLGGKLAYNHDGNLVRALPIVYECGNHCNCSQNCYNRVTQKGVQHRLEIFKTVNKGWGVRSWDFISAGSFVCEYTGELLDANAANDLDNDEYLFNLDFKKGNEARWGHVSDVPDSIASGIPGAVPDGADYVIDASKHGNVARFINHSCDPNLFVQCVLYDHHDLRIPHVMLFASSNIAPFHELTYDYGYTLNSVYDANGNVKTKACHCGAAICSRRMY
jgi:euchromatic histone-lysine N-methyltransferase